MQDGVLSACEERGYGLQILPCNADSPQLITKLLVAHQRARLGGLILTPPISEQPVILQALSEQELPFVRIISASSEPDDGMPCVYVDDRSAARDITTHLIQLGHSRIGFLGGDEHGSNIERHAGYLEALRNHGIALDEALVVNSHFTFDDGFSAARRLLTIEPRPTAIFGSNDEIAAGVLAAARSVGLSVPWDLSVAGFEDSPFSRQAWPALTTARQSPHDIARAAALRLMQLIENTQVDAGNRVPNRFAPELVVRSSTTPPRSAE